MQCENKLYNKERCSNIYVVLILAYCIIFLTPYLSSYISRIIQISIMLAWVCLVVLKVFTRSIEKSHLLIVGLISIWVFIIIFYKLLGVSSSEWGNYFMQMAYFLPVIMFLFAKKYMSIKQKKTILMGILLVAMFNIVDNIRLNIIYPGASEKVINLNWYPELKGLNIGNTQFNTMALLLFDAVFILFLNVKQKISKTSKILLVVSLIAIAYYIVACGMRGSIVLFLIASVILIYYSYKLDRNKEYVAKGFIVLGVGLFVICLFAQPILEFLADISEERLAIRFRDLSSFFNEGGTEDSFSGRLELIKLSLETFTTDVKSILFGVGDHRLESVSGSGTGGFYASGIGGHSEFIDTLARYGLLGAVFTILIMRNSYKTAVIIEKKNNCKIQWFVLFLIFLCCGFTKAIYFPNIGIIMFLLIPLISDFLNNEVDKEFN